MRRGEKMKYSEVSVRIKELRVSKGMSQTELANLLGVSKSVISSYENAVHLPPYDVLIKLAKIFSVSCDYLLGNTNRKVFTMEGLTEVQISSIESIIYELKEMNRKK